MTSGNTQTRRVRIDTSKTGLPFPLGSPRSVATHRNTYIGFLIKVSTNKNQFSDIFPKRLAALMEKKDATQADLADVAGVSQPTISSWLKGQGVLPKAGELYLLAKFFGVTMEVLLQGEPVEPITTEELDRTAPLDVEAQKIKSWLKQSGLTLADLEQIIDTANRTRLMLNDALTSKKTNSPGLKEAKKIVYRLSREVDDKSSPPGSAPKPPPAPPRRRGASRASTSSHRPKSSQQNPSS